MNKLFRSPYALIFFGVVVSAVGMVIYWQFYRETPPQYRLQAVEKGDLSQTVSASGTINPVTMVSVGTQVSGMVKKLYVDFNSKVKQGQILLELDDALLAAQQQQSAANVQIAEASLELATANEARMKGLYAQEFVSRQEWDNAIQAKKSAAAQLKLAQAIVQKDRVNLAYTVIRSPVSGVVVDRSVDVGQTVAASLQTPTLFKIAQDLARMQINANFAEADIGNIRVGQVARITVDAFPNRSFKGAVKLIRLNPTNQQNVVTYDVVINVSNPDKILLPGMTAYVSIAVAERKQVLLLPNAALRFKPANDGLKKSPAHRPANLPGVVKSKPDEFPGKVYVLAKHELKPISVTLGITDSRNTEIIDGELKAGDQVVVGVDQEPATPPSGSATPMRMRLF